MGNEERKFYADKPNATYRHDSLFVFCFKRSLKQAVYVAYFDNSSVTGWTRASMQRRLSRKLTPRVHFNAMFAPGPMRVREKNLELTR